MQQANNEQGPSSSVELDHIIRFNFTFTHATIKSRTSTQKSIAVQSHTVTQAEKERERGGHARQTDPQTHGQE